MLAEQIEREQPADQRGGQSRQHGQRMEIAFVENRQDHVHDEDRQSHENRQIPHRVLESQRFALQARAQRRRHDLRRCFVDKVGRVADRNAGFEIKGQCDAGELIEMVDGLRPQGGFPVHQRIERQEPLAVVGANIEQRQILRRRPSGICGFQNHLILIRRFLDQIQVILRVGVAQQREDAGPGYAVHFCFFASEFDVETRRVVIVVR